MVMNLPVNAGDAGLIPGLRRSVEKEMATHSNILAWKSHGQSSLAGYTVHGAAELDMTEHTSMSCHAFTIKGSLLLAR